MRGWVSHVTFLSGSCRGVRSWIPRDTNLPDFRWGADGNAHITRCVCVASIMAVHALQDAGNIDAVIAAPHPDCNVEPSQVRENVWQRDVPWRGRLVRQAYSRQMIPVFLFSLVWFSWVFFWSLLSTSFFCMILCHISFLGRLPLGLPGREGSVVAPVSLCLSLGSEILATCRVGTWLIRLTRNASSAFIGQRKRTKWTTCPVMCGVSWKRVVVSWRSCSSLAKGCVFRWGCITCIFALNPFIERSRVMYHAPLHRPR